MTGAAVTEAAYDGPYWARNIREPVHFMRALQAAIADGHRVFVEVGPHPTLAGSVRELLALGKVDGQIVSTLVRETDEFDALLATVGGVYAAGCAIDWAAFNEASSPAVELPRYPWQREKYWGEAEVALRERIGAPAAAFAGTRIDVPEPTWERTINNKYLPYADEHVVDGLVLLPGAAFVDAALSLKRELDSAGGPLAVENVAFSRPLVLDRGGDVVLRSVFDPHTRHVVFHGRTGSSTWVRHCEARLSETRARDAARCDIVALQQRLGAPQDIPALYARLERLGLAYGNSFRRIAELRAQGDEVLCRLTLAGLDEDSDIRHALHPLLLDGAFQSLLTALVLNGADSPWVPTGIDEVTLRAPITGPVVCIGRVKARSEREIVGELWLSDASGSFLAHVDGLRCVPAKRAQDPLQDLLFTEPFEPALPVGEPANGAWMVLSEDGCKPGGFGEAIAKLLMRAGCGARADLRDRRRARPDRHRPAR